MFVAGVFLIQGLEGSRFGAPTLWVLNGCVDREGRGEEDRVSSGPGVPSSREDFPQPVRHATGVAGTRVAMVFVVMS